MITPDDTGAAHGDAPEGRGGLIGMAALVVLGGLIAVGVLSSPGPAALEEHSTSTVDEAASPADLEHFDVEHVTTGEPLDWELSMAIDDRHPLAMLVHDRTLYLFTVAESRGGPDSGGLMVWRSGDGTDWEGLGEVIPAGHRVTTVDSTAQGLVAASTRLEDNALVLWESADAVEWTESEIPVENDGAYSIDVPFVAGASETTLVVASKSRYDRERLLEDRLLAKGIELELSDLSWELRWLGERGQRLEVVGPFGVPVLQTPIDALDLNVEQQRELTSELFDPLGTDVWARSESNGWQPGLIPDARSIDSIVVTPDGRLVAYGQGAGPMAKITDDGINWKEVASTVHPRRAQPWRQGFVGAIDAPDLMTSQNGRSWQAAGLAQRFPDEMQWASVALGAGEGGAAMFVAGTRPLTDPEGVEPLELVTDLGSTLVLDLETRTFHLITEGRRHEESGIDIDLQREVVYFEDRESGEILASVELSELRRADLEHRKELLGDGGPVGVLAFTGDGEDWVIQDMAPYIGEHAMIGLLEVTVDRLVAVVSDTVDGLTPGTAPGFEIWSAPIP